MGRDAVYQEAEFGQGSRRRQRRTHFNGVTRSWVNHPRRQDSNRAVG
jgi:hypothetical protein